MVTLLKPTLELQVLGVQSYVPTYAGEICLAVLSPSCHIADFIPIITSSRHDLISPILKMLLIATESVCLCSAYSPPYCIHTLMMAQLPVA